MARALARTVFVGASLLVSAPFALAQQTPPDTEDRFQSDEVSKGKAVVTTDPDPSPRAGIPTTDVLVVAEGYRDDPDEKARFFDRARGMRATLRDVQHEAAEPMRSVTNFDFYYLWAPSKSRAPWRCAEHAGPTKFGACMDQDGTLGTCDPAVDRATKATAQSLHLGAKPDHVLVTVILIRFMSSDPKDKDNFDDVKRDSFKVYGDPDKSTPAERKRLMAQAATSSEKDARDLADTPEQIYLKVGNGSLCKKRGGHTVTGGGYEIGRVRQVDIDMKAFVHEFGHARFGLDDEYSNDDTSVVKPGTDDAFGVAQFPNCTTDPTGARWKDIPEVFAHGPDAGVYTQAQDTFATPTHHPLNAPDHKLIEGGSGMAKGVWHAFRLCRMDQSRTENFCPVCIHAILQANKKDPPEPRWNDAVTPKEGETVSLDPEALRAKKATIKAAWLAGNATHTSAAIECYHLSLSKDGRTAWKGDLEGQILSADVPITADGDYVLTLEAEGIAIAALGKQWAKIERHFSVGEKAHVESSGINGHLR